MPIMAIVISIDHTGLSAVCQRHHIRRLSLFGSVLRCDFRRDSDVDMLVEFEPGQVPGFLALYGIEAELSRLVGGRKVDLVTERSLNRRLHDRVLGSAEVEYAADDVCIGSDTSLAKTKVAGSNPVFRSNFWGPAAVKLTGPLIF
jgi:predicted nucleotidyltransferase